MRFSLLLLSLSLLLLLLLLLLLSLLLSRVVADDVALLCLRTAPLEICTYTYQRSDDPGNYTETMYCTFCSFRE